MAYEKNLELNQTKDKKHVVLIFSLEMSAIQIFDKIISLVSYVDYYKIKKRQLQVNEQAKLKSILRQEHLEDLPIIFYDDGSLSLSKSFFKMDFTISQFNLSLPQPSCGT